MDETQVLKAKEMMNLAISNHIKNRYSDELKKKYEKSFNEIDQDLIDEPVFNAN